MRFKYHSNTIERLQDCGKYFIESSHSNKNILEDIKDKDYFDVEKNFGNNNPLILEIGCGLGRFACEYALKHPEYNIHAIERVATIILSGAERAKQENIENVRFMQARAECLQKYFPHESIDSIFLNFSCPLPKRGYIKQRLTSPRFLEIYKDLLIPNGYLYQKTDQKDFFDYSLETIRAAGFDIDYLTDDLHNSQIPNIMTEYEARFVLQGQPIYALIARKKS